MWNELKLTPNDMKAFGIPTLTKEEIQNQQGYYWEYNREEGGYFVFRKEVVSAIEYFTEMTKRFPDNPEARKHCDTARKALIYLLHDVFSVFEDNGKAKESNDET